MNVLTKFILELKYKEYKNELGNLDVRIFLPTEVFNLKDMPIQDGVHILLSACEFIEIIDAVSEIHRIYIWDIVSYEFNDVIDVKLRNNTIKLYY
jgi:hypothetical protein